MCSIRPQYNTNQLPIHVSTLCYQPVVALERQPGNTLQWRHISITGAHFTGRSHVCSTAFQAYSFESIKAPHYWYFARWLQLSPLVSPTKLVNSPHKRGTFPCHDVILVMPCRPRMRTCSVIPGYVPTTPTMTPSVSRTVISPRALAAPSRIRRRRRPTATTSRTRMDGLR